MLKKLMKYDLSKPLKFLVVFYAVTIVSALIARLFSLFDNLQIFQILSAIFKGVTYSAIASVLVNTFIQILMRFKNNLFCDQSYLTHTLPVEKSTILLSKYLSALIIVILSTLVSLLALFIMLFSSEFMEGFKTLLSSSVADQSIGTGLVLALLIISLFFEICSLLSLAFLSFIKGYSFNSKRGIKGVCYFIAYYIVQTVITLSVAILACLIFGSVDNLFSEVINGSNLLVLLIIVPVLNAVFAVAFYFISDKEFNKGVNVD